MKRQIAILLILSAALGTTAWAGQNVVVKRGKGAPSGIISGTVLGPNDKPAPHAVITYQSSSGIAPHVVHADARGRFTITKLHTDNYDLRASAKGIFSEWQKNFQVQSGHTSEIILRLIYAKEMPKQMPSSVSKPASKN
ncbi:MAG: carboxypeptidase regulatory-like domain-containing protein [Acidobacteria bacterium]|nr:carboxypeptidase regulatory-like domain-containing protein [Acidobacteriota bacterium]MBS1864689.1 carboxypeptidase regulatory-like domain-containing protein [Acidobacteriota bacterium]